MHPLDKPKPQACSHCHTNITTRGICRPCLREMGIK